MRRWILTSFAAAAMTLGGSVGSPGLAAETAAQPTAKVEIEVLKDQTYVNRGDRELKADVYRPKRGGAHPGILVVHGGAWFAGSKGQLARAAEVFAESGYTAVCIEYRLAPKDIFPAQIEDCKSAIRWMRSEAERLHIDPERLGAYGYSAGGQLVALLGTTDKDSGLEGPDASKNSPSTRVQAVAAGGAPCDFRLLPSNLKTLSYWLGGTRGEKPKQYELASPARFVSKDDPPLFLFHGSDDLLVPKLSPIAMQVVCKLNGVECEYVEVQEAGHIEAVRDRDTLEKIVSFFNRHLNEGR